jgi:quinol monooxygenase YgiN
MFIAIVDFETSAADRPAALAQLAAEQAEVQAMPGCIGCRAFASPTDDTSVTILHEWEDAESFQAYATSEPFERSGVVLRPMMTGTPSSRRFRAELLETVA